MSFVIPSIFTAVDRMSAPMRTMGRSFDTLSNKAAAAAARMERSMRRVQDKAGSIASSTGIAGAAIAAPVAMITKTAMDFEKGVGSLRTIVSNLSDEAFAP